MTATQPQTSAASSTSAAPARASHAPATQEADTGTPGLDSLELPTEADLASAFAELNPEVHPAPAPEADAAEAETDTEGDDSAPADESPEAAASPDAAATDAAAESDPLAAAPGEAADASGTPPTDPTATPGKVPEGLQTRFDELTAARYKAEERAEKLEQQLAGYQARDAGRLEPDVLETIDDPSTLERQKSQWSQLHRWAAQNLTAPEATLGEKVYTTEEVGQIFAQTSQLLTEAAPRRAAYLAERAQFDAGTTQLYPWAADTKSPEGALLHRSLKEIPQLRSLPNARLIVADSIIGMKLRAKGIKIDDALIARLTQEQARPAKPALSPAARAAASAPAAAARRLPPSAPGRPGTVPPRATGREQIKHQALKRVNRGNASESDLAASIAAIL